MEFVKQEVQIVPIIQPEEPEFEEFVLPYASSYGPSVVFLPDEAPPGVVTAFWSFLLAIAASRTPIAGLRQR
jgi:hypothetical protein